MNKELKTAIKIITQINKLLNKRFSEKNKDNIKFKKNKEIVTETDMEANTYITKVIQKSFPTHDIISEENYLSEV